MLRLAGVVKTVVFARCNNLKCHSKQVFPEMGEAFEKPAEKVLASVSRQRRQDGSLGLPIVRCVWCQAQAFPLEDVA